MAAKTALIVLVGFSICSVSWAEDPVAFPDAQLKAAVEDELWIWDPTPTDMLSLTYLKAISSGIGDLTGLEYAVNLQTLMLRWNRISDISALSTLTNLQYLDIHDNTISDLSPLAGLDGLRTLVLRFNRIRDISALADLTALEHLDLRGNPLDDDAFTAYLPQIETNNPGLELYYDTDSQRILTLSSSVGGSVGRPGEGQFVYDNGLTVDLWAKADPGFAFAGWSGSFSSSENPTRISMDADHNVHANFALKNDPDAEVEPVYFSDETLKTAVEQALGVPDPDPYAMLALTELVCPDCGISSLVGIEYASNLSQLDVSGNAISDLSPLTALTWLDLLDVEGNPLDDQSYDVYLPVIALNNPQISILYDQSTQHKVTMTAADGGSVTQPGRGTFTYNNGRIVTLEAHANPGFVFAGWSGTFESTDNPVFLEVYDDHTIEAVFALAPDTLCVDCNAPNGPIEDGSNQHPFNTIQEAINVVDDGGTVLVRPGLYPENIDLLGKPISLIGLDPQSAELPVISGNDAGPIVSFVNGEDPNCTMIGFAITAGSALDTAAIVCTESSPIVANCLIVGNRILDESSAVVRCRDSQAAFVNCTVADNVSDGFLLIDSPIVLTNSIVRNTVALIGVSKPAITYCDILNDWPDTGNIDVDPLFARPGRWDDMVALELQWVPGDYHLTSRAGRWEPATRVWVQDGVTSPCIDAGDPAGPVGDEPMPNGNTVNLGAYGGTLCASISAIAP